MRSAAAWWLSVLGVWLALAQHALAQGAGDIEKRAAETIARLRLQTELPTGDLPDNGWTINLPEINLSADWVWVVLVVGVIVLLYSIRDELPWLRFGRQSQWTGDGGEGGAAAAGHTHGAPVAADELARDGRYVEAMHVLLLNALAEIRRRVGEHFADSLTSREILRRANLPGDGRALLRDLITRVELSYFGAYPAEQQDYLACRRSFDLLLRSLPAEAPA
jgi:hypothetical protein